MLVGCSPSILRRMLGSSGPCRKHLPGASQGGDRHPHPGDGLCPLRMGCWGSIHLSSRISAPQPMSDPGGPWPPQLLAPGSRGRPQAWTVLTGGSIVRRSPPQDGMKARASCPWASLCPGETACGFPSPGLTGPQACWQPPLPAPFPNPAPSILGVRPLLELGCY